MPPTFSVVIPVYNAAPYLKACLDSVARLDPAPFECIVVDDGSTDGSAAIAERPGVRVLSGGRRRGPGVARNLGAAAASGEFLFFLDADVIVSPGAIARLLERFAEDPTRDAVIGSYDDQPGSPNFSSQYRNLLHAFTHQTSRPRTSIFWTGCGAIRRQVFIDLGGFHESQATMEDIELGLRLRQVGREIWLDKGLVVKHLKTLTPFSIVKTDVFARAIPWTRLILRFRSMPADLNLQWAHRLSVLLVALAAAAVPILGALWAADALPPGAWPVSAAGATATVLLLGFLNRNFYRYLARSKGPWFALRALPFHCLYFFCGGIGFAAGILLHLLSPLSARPSTLVSRRQAGVPTPLSEA
jgi:glycosyltransferase involved in cell wall biosynthesis